MSDGPRERWSITVELPSGIANGGRFMARVLKHLLRSWGVKCTALQTDAEVRRLQGIIDAQAEELARRAEKKEAS